MRANDCRTGRFFLILQMVILLVVAAACGGGGSGGGSGQLIINGTWVSDTQSPLRGRFVMSGSTSISGYNGTLSGTLQFFDEHDTQVADEPVTGTLSEQGIGSNPYWDIEFATADGKLTFFAPSYDGYTSASQMVGSFTNTLSTTSVSGSWHSNPTGGPTDCVIDKAFYQTDFTFQDLAWNGSKLVGVATPTGGSAEIYEFDTSGATLSGTLKSLSPAPVGPKGIAWDGTKYRVLGVNGPYFTLDAYDPGWTASGSTVTGNGIMGDVPTWIAYWGGYLWYAPLLGFGAYRIDPGTASMEAVSGIQLNRPTGADSDGTTIWSAYFPPGGIWPAFDNYNTSGTLLKAIYAPEKKSASDSAVACEGSSYLWVSIGQNLYRLDVR